MKFSQGRLSNKDKSWLSVAEKMAALSKCKYKHGAILVRGGRALSVGVNSYTSGVNLFDFIPIERRSIHAEVACLKQAAGDLTGAVMYVARVNTLGELRMSKPCSRCQEALIAAGIKRVVYTIDSSIEL